MRRLLPMLAVLSLGCAPSSQPSGEAAKVPAAPETAPKAEALTPAPQAAAKKVAAFDAETIKAWKADLQAAMDGENWDEAKALIQKLDPAFDAEFLSEVESQKVESFQGQLDTSEPKETVIQVRQEGVLEGHGEHESFYWIGIISDQKLAGTYVRPRLLVCAFADRAGLTFGFSEKAAGPKASLWVVEQDVQSCGTLIEVHYKKELLQVADGKLVSKTAKPPSSVEYDRMEHMREE